MNHSQLGQRTAWAWSCYSWPLYTWVLGIGFLGLTTLSHEFSVPCCWLSGIQGPGAKNWTRERASIRKLALFYKNMDCTSFSRISARFCSICCDLSSSKEVPIVVQACVFQEMWHGCGLSTKFEALPFGGLCDPAAWKQVKMTVEMYLSQPPWVYRLQLILGAGRST